MNQDQQLVVYNQPGALQKRSNDPCNNVNQQAYAVGEVTEDKILYKILAAFLRIERAVRNQKRQ